MTETILFVGIGVLVLLFAVWMIVTYRSLVQNSDKVKDKWSEVLELLADRFDLVNEMRKISKNSSEDTSDFSKDSKTTLKYYAKAHQNDSIIDGVRAEKILAKKTLPEFANILDNDSKLGNTKRVSDLESRIRYSDKEFNRVRSQFNNIVLDYNRRIENIPVNLIAKVAKFEPKEIFMDDSEARNNSIHTDFE